MLLRRRTRCNKWSEELPRKDTKISVRMLPRWPTTSPNQQTLNLRIKDPSVNPAFTSSNLANNKLETCCGAVCVENPHTRWPSSTGVVLQRDGAVIYGNKKEVEAT